MLYWLVCKPFGIITISSCTIQICNRIIKHNLGDDLNFFLIRELTGKRVMNYNNMFGHFLKIKHYTCIGSIFDWCVDSFSIVWGTGDLFGGKKNITQPLKITAVRGPLTRKVLLDKGIPCPEVYGDPALLLPCVYTPKKEKRYKLGIIPHYDDYTLDSIQTYNQPNEKGVRIIPTKGYTNWKNFVDEVCSCEYIASSSLHGLIISDAYNIPNVWIKFSNNITGGGGTFKYLDYFSSVGRTDKAPINFVDRKIDTDIIIQYIKSYKHILIDVGKLIKACPFLNDDDKNKLVKDIPINYPFLTN